MGSTLTVRDLCERYGVSEHTVLGWIRSGELRAVNVGRKPGGKNEAVPLTSSLSMRAAAWKRSFLDSCNSSKMNPARLCVPVGASQINFSPCVACPPTLAINRSEIVVPAGVENPAP